MRILSLSGFVPDQICDTVRFTQYAGDRNISHYCGYVSDFISQVIQDNSIDGAVFPKSCDSTRTIGSYISDLGKFWFQIHVPSHGTSGELLYLASEIKAYKDELEGFFEIKLDDTIKRTEYVNKRNNKIGELYRNLESLSFYDYLLSIHENLTKPLLQQNINVSEGKIVTPKRVFVVGSFLSNLDIANSIENAGLTVVGDTLPESGRLASLKETCLNGNIYENIAESMLSMRLSPTQNTFSTIIKADKEEMIYKDVKGVIYITQKYCEAYDYLYSVYKALADDMGLSILKISLNDTEDSRKVRLMLEAFADTL